MTLREKKEKKKKGLNLRSSHHKRPRSRRLIIGMLHPSSGNPRVSKSWRAERFMCLSEHVGSDFLGWSSGGRTGGRIVLARGFWRVYRAAMAVRSVMWPDRARGERMDSPGSEAARVGKPRSHGGSVEELKWSPRIDLGPSDLDRSNGPDQTVQMRKKGLGF
ncbi:hypothetical protein V6N11_044359 [Hibiscus sabdariffa]|uniref:Uncharacterized protein n=1 Tax=Hibiscus sabdariffa TaxID=183260 RepID=A0ABR2RFD3_9ROSI